MNLFDFVFLTLYLSLIGYLIKNTTYSSNKEVTVYITDKSDL